MAAMKPRDWNYIEGRLLYPAGEVTEAIARLYQLGKKYEADQLMAKVKELHDVCRTVRRNLSGEQYDGR
jgi:hypothetical protein